MCTQTFSLSDKSIVLKPLWNGGVCSSKFLVLNLHELVLSVEYGSDEGSEDESEEEEEVIGPDGQKIVRKKKKSK